MSDVFALQREIDGIDDDIIAPFGRRFASTRRVGKIKLTLGQPLFDPERRREQSDPFAKACVDRGLEVGMARLLIASIGSQVRAGRLEQYRSPPEPSFADG